MAGSLLTSSQSKSYHMDKRSYELSQLHSQLAPAEVLQEAIGAMALCTGSQSRPNSEYKEGKEASQSEHLTHGARARQTSYNPTVCGKKLTKTPSDISHSTSSLILPSPRETPTSINDLPEELLDQIVSYLAPSQPSPVLADLNGLSAISAVSQVLHRIVEPHLYHTIPVWLARAGRRMDANVGGSHGIFEYSLPSATKCNVGKLVRTLRLRPDLAHYVKVLVLRRNDYGFNVRWKLGLYGYEKGSPFELTWPDLEFMDRTEDALVHIDDLNRSTLPLITTRSLDPFYVNFHELLCRLHNLEHLNLSGCLSDGPRHAWLDVIMARGYSKANLRFLPHHGLSSLKNLTLQWTRNNTSALFPLFNSKLPNLQSLKLHGPSFKATTSNLAHWQSAAGSSNIKHIIVVDICPCKFQDVADNTMSLMFQACKALETLHITTKEKHRRIHFRAFLRNALHHIINGTLRSLELYEHLPRRYKHELVSSYPTTMSVCRYSTGLEYLTMDIDDLITVMSPYQSQNLMKHPIPGSFRVYNGALHHVYLDVTLPRTLKSLRLRVGEHEIIRGALIDVMVDLSWDVRARFPVLECIKIDWHRFEQVVSLGVNYSHVIARFKHAGVSVVEEFLTNDGEENREEEGIQGSS